VFPDDELSRQIIAVGETSSIALALLALFTNQRYAAWRDRKEEAAPTLGTARIAVTLDLSLLIFTVAVVLALSPLAVKALDQLSFLRLGGVLNSLFTLVWLGLISLGLFQAWLTRRRWRDTDWKKLRRDRQILNQQ
jgi:hypothetical protein